MSDDGRRREDEGRVRTLQLVQICENLVVSCWEGDGAVAILVFLFLRFVSSTQKPPPPPLLHVEARLHTCSQITEALSSKRRGRVWGAESCCELGLSQLAVS